MTYRHICAFVISLFVIVLSLASTASSQTLAVRCNQYQSCKLAGMNLSIRPKLSVSMSFEISAKNSDFAACINGSLIKSVDTTISNCEAFIQSGAGNPRDRAHAMFMLGHAYMRSSSGLGDMLDLGNNKSIKIWNESFAEDASYVDPLLAIARMYGLSEQVVETLEILNKAERVAPQDWRVHTLKVGVFGGMNNLPEMLNEAEKAMKINPDEPEVRRVYAGALKINGRLAEAAQQYLIAAESYDPQKDKSLDMMREESAWISLAGVYAELQKPAMAAAAITKYMESNGAISKHFSMYDLRAGYFEKAGMYNEAAEDLKLAAASAPPPFAEALNDRRVFALAKAGKKENASDDLRYTIEHGSLQSRLKLQVFLKNQGYSRVIINGRYDDATKDALDACLQDEACAPGVGRAI
jgi:tetratricopeptide (TPR) repeat protein